MARLIKCNCLAISQCFLRQFRSVEMAFDFLRRQQSFYWHTLLIETFLGPYSGFSAMQAKECWGFCFSSLWKHLANLAESSLFGTNLSTLMNQSTLMNHNESLINQSIIINNDVQNWSSTPLPWRLRSHNRSIGPLRCNCNRPEGKGLSGWASKGNVRCQQQHGCHIGQRGWPPWSIRCGDGSAMKCQWNRVERSFCSSRWPNPEIRFGADCCLQVMWHV
jgi:hypothetical protein